MIRRFLRRRTPDDSTEALAPEGGAFDKLGMLRASDLFHDLTDEQMGDVEKMTVMAQCKRGNLIYTPGEASETLFFAEEGQSRALPAES